jgi:hypothetical protein
MNVGSMVGPSGLFAIIDHVIIGKKKETYGLESCATLSPYGYVTIVSSPDLFPYLVVPHFARISNCIGFREMCAWQCPETTRPDMLKFGRVGLSRSARTIHSLLGRPPLIQDLRERGLVAQLTRYFALSDCDEFDNANPPILL